MVEKFYNFGIIYVNDKLKEFYQTNPKKNCQMFYQRVSEFLILDQKLKDIMLGEKKDNFTKLIKKILRKFISLSKKNLYHNKVFQNLYLLHMAYDQSNKKKNIGN